MTKEEMKEKLFDVLYESNGHCGGGGKCADIAGEYAKAQAIAFAEWMREQGWRPIYIDLWEKQDDEEKTATTTELYTLFLQSLTSKEK